MANKYLQDLDESIQVINSLKSISEQKQRDEIQKLNWFFKFDEFAIPNNWKVVNILDITWVVTCGVAKKPDYIDAGIPFLSAQNTRPFKNNLNKIRYISKQDFEKFTVGSKPKKDDILYTRVGNCGEAAKIEFDFDFAIYVSLTLIKPIHQLINSNYFVAFLNSKFGKAQAGVGAIGTGLQNLNVNNVRKFKIPLPPLAEQERIVAKLDALFAQHDVMKKSLERIPQLLKDFRQQILSHAVTGKLTEEWRKGKRLDIVSINTLKEKLTEEVAILNEKHIEEGKSRIKINPIQLINYSNAKWPIFTVESTCIAIVDCLHETAKFSASGYKIIDTNSIEPFRINEKKIRFVNSEIYKKWVNRLTPKKGDIAYTREGSIGNVVMIPVDKLYCIGQRTMLFRFSTLLNERFCEIYMNSQKFKSQVFPHIKGVASQHVNIRDLRTLEIPIPSFQEQNEIVARIDSLFAKADAIELRYQKLKAKIASLPQAILHKAFKGELIPQLPTDGDAKDLLAEIIALKNEVKRKKK